MEQVFAIQLVRGRIIQKSTSNALFPPCAMLESNLIRQISVRQSECQDTVEINLHSVKKFVINLVSKFPEIAVEMLPK